MNTNLRLKHIYHIRRPVKSNIEDLIFQLHMKLKHAIDLANKDTDALYKIKTHVLLNTNNMISAVNYHKYE
jgi:hypothetical protein